MSRRILPQELSRFLRCKTGFAANEEEQNGASKEEKDENREKQDETNEEQHGSMVTGATWWPPKIADVDGGEDQELLQNTNSARSVAM